MSAPEAPASVASTETKSSASDPHMEVPGKSEPRMTRHDLDNRYFGKDLLIFRNFDIFR